MTRELWVSLPWTATLDEVRFGALQDMVFNLGLAGLLEFRRMLMAIQSGDWATAASEMLNSKWATQVGARATRLAQQMRTGQWV